VATTHILSRLTFWPLPVRWPSVVDGYKQAVRPLAFSPDSRWLATSWADGHLRLWPLPGSGSSEVKVFASPQISVWEGLAFDPRSRYLFAVGNEDGAWIVPLDGSPPRQLQVFSKDTLLYGAAVSPTGRRVATAFGYGKGSKTLRVWDVETGTVRLMDLPVPSPPPATATRAPTGYEGGITSLAFLDDSTLYTAGHGGIRRWNLETGAHELVRSFEADQSGQLLITSDRRQLLYCRADLSYWLTEATFEVIDLLTGGTHHVEGFGESVLSTAATQGPAMALIGRDGSVRVGLRSGGGSHWLLGHAGMVDQIAISPDLRWVASTGEDNTLRLWPMPDLSKAPLHTLPHDELVAKLKSLTNLRAVRDAKSATGWSIELGLFPGWKNLPTW
jgi:WD40 repeat protein